MLTNLGSFFSPVYIAAAVQCDDPTKGVPSDHNTAVAEPLAGAGTTVSREYTVRTSRPLPESGINEFGSWLQGVQWQEHLTPDRTPTKQPETMELILNQQVDSIFPTKTVCVSSQDLPYITGDIKNLDKYVKKEFKSKGKSDKYLKLKKIYDIKMKKAASDQLTISQTKYVTDMMGEAPCMAYRALRKMGARPGDCKDSGSFTLTNHQDDNLTPKQSVDKMAEYFSAISQEYEPILMHLLPERVQIQLKETINKTDIPHIEAWH